MTFKDNFRNLVNGELKYAKDFLIELSGKETVEQLTIAARILREDSIKVEIEQTRDDYLLDIVGTGGDKSSSFNISTISMLVAAGAGCKIAKHFNKAVTSPVGSADFLEEIGINYDLTPEQNQKLFKKTNICLMYAPRYHPAMEKIAEIRSKIKERTIFNLIGPLTNPANAQSYLMGACSIDIAEKLAKALKELDVKRALVVCSLDGLDEISIGKATESYEVNYSKKIESDLIFPDEYNCKGSVKGLKVSSAEESVEICKNILAGELSDYRKVVLMNAGAAIYINGKAKNIYEGVAKARRSIDQGFASDKLEQLIETSNSL